MGALALASLGALALAGPAAAKTIHVRAKKDDAIARAIDRAKAGDRLVVHKGTYRGPVVVDKRVRIVGHKKKRGRKSRKPVIDVGCATDTAFDVTAEGVRLRRLKLRGGNVFTLDMSFVDAGVARQLRVTDRCDALYGINIFQGGAIQLLQNRASGYLDAGIYVGGIIDTVGSALSIEGNDSFGNNRGLIVEDSFDIPVDIRVIGNHFHGNTLAGEGQPKGIFVHNSDGVRFSDNLVSDNGVYGIHLDANSDGNRLFDNVFRGNPDNVLDEGVDNCGSGNVPAGEFDPC
jgi:parallel beta-helix repeat protein